MNRIYILAKYHDEGYVQEAGNYDCFDHMIYACNRKCDLLYYAKCNNVTQKDAYVIVIIGHWTGVKKFVVDKWQDKETWRQPK